MKKLFNSFGYALQGWKHCFLKEQNFRIHISAAVVAMAMAILLECSAGEWLAIMICIGAVISLEMINTAIERLCDLYQKETDPNIKVIKDVAAGAVLVSAVVAAICAGIIFIPKIISIL